MLPPSLVPASAGEAVADVVAVAGLLALLVTVYRHPRPRTEAIAALAATAAVLATGLLPWHEVVETVERLAPVVAFLAATLVVADVCARAGLFEAASRWVRRGARGPASLLAGSVVLAALVTVTLGLDATAVLLTPVVVAAALASGVPSRPAAFACVRMANSGSVLLPASNLTNLLALPYLGLTFVGFALAMAPVFVVVVAVEYVGLRLLLRRDLRTGGADVAEAAPTEAVPVPLTPVVVVALMLVGFVVTSVIGVEPWWAAAAAALVLAAWARRHRLAEAADVARAAHPEFAVLVLALGLVVAAVAEGFLGGLVADLVPTTASTTSLVLVALLATALANLLTNLSAALLLLPLVAPLGDVAVLAALLGLNIGSGLTYAGSLANLLWRRGLASAARPSLADFHRVSLALTPLSLAAGVGVLIALH